MWQCLCCAPAKGVQRALPDAGGLFAEECANLRRRVPATIVTGFLGAGKTTFINWILEGSHGKNLCVIQNEFGVVPIDDALMLRGEQFAETAVMAMADGCVCCKIRGDLVEGLKSLAKSLATDRLHVDGVIVETSGQSEVGPVVRTFLADSFVQRNFRLDAVVAVVDASSAASRLHRTCCLPGEAGAQSNVSDEDILDECGVLDSPERSLEDDTACLLCEQLSLADVVLLNKLDLMPTEEQDSVPELVQQVNPTSVLVRCSHGQVDLSSVLDIEAFSSAAAFEIGAVFSEVSDSVSRRSSTRAEAHQLHSRFGSVDLERDSDLDELAFTDWLDEVLEEHGDRIYRAKGVLFFHGVDTASALQCVQQHVEVERMDEGRHNTESRRSRIVLIGAVSGLEEVLAEGFASLE